MRKVKPVNDALHKGYQFFIKVTASRVHLANGDSTAYLPTTPSGSTTTLFYDLRVGCYPDSLSFTDSSNFVTQVNKYVGDSVLNTYTFHNPTPNRNWCRLETNIFATENAEPWQTAAKFGTDVLSF
jgi:hypothetical protein